MKLETLLNAMQFAQTQSINLGMLERLDPYFFGDRRVLLWRRENLLKTLRARILARDEQQRQEIERRRNVIMRYDDQCAEQRQRIAEWETFHGFHMGDIEFIETMHDKDVEIAELRAVIRKLVPEDQRWFWSDEWQEKERQVDVDIAEGRYQTFDNMDDFIAGLKGDNDV